MNHPAQTYETTIHDRDSGQAFSFIVIPARALGPERRDVPPADVVARRLGLNGKPDRPRRWSRRGPFPDVAPWALPFAIDIALGRDEDDYHRWGPFFLEEHLFGARSQREGAGPSAFAQYLAYAPVVPFESSPLTPKSGCR